MLTDTARVYFDRFELQVRERRLLVNGQPAALGARAFDMLVALVERAGHLVTKDQLMDLIWPDVVVEENNLHTQVSALRKVLGKEIIATIPGRGYRFTATLRDAVPSEELPAASVPARPFTAARPPPTIAAAAPDTAGLIGRDTELALLDSMLDAHRLVTVVGAGGIGKTVLARACMAARTGRHPHGSAWADLAALSDAAAVPGQIAEALGLRLAGRDLAAALADALRPRGLLLVLDNAEHLVAAVAAIAERLVQNSPGLRVLVTSQVPLNVAEEHVLRLEPLSVPPRDVSPDEALHHGAVALFVERGRAADRRFVFEADRIDAVIAICRQLDGLPLALEMCAARLPLLGLAKLRDSLAQRFRLLTTGQRSAPPRQRTLHAALDWSHELLGDDERAVFRRVGVCAGGFTLELATAVAGDERLDEWQVIDLLASLVARSLVTASVDDPPRYRLPETMRVYALERLAESGEEALVRERHARAVRALYERACQAMQQGASADLVRARCEPELDNAREAFLWAVQHDVTTAAAVAALAARFTAFSARRVESHQWLTACEPLIDRVTDVPVRAQWWLELARFRLFFYGPSAPAAAREARALYVALGDELGEFNACVALVRGSRERSAEAEAALARLQALLARHPEWPAYARLTAAGALALAATWAEDYELAKQHRLAEVKLAAEAGSVFAMHAAQTNVLALLRAQERWDEAIALGRELFTSLRDGGELVNSAYAGLHLIASLLYAGRIAEASADASAAWTLARQIDLPLMGDTVALLAARQGRPRAAARLLGRAKAHYEARGFPRNNEETRRNFDHAEAYVRERLDPTTIAALESLGAHLSDAQVVALIDAADDPL